MNVKKMLALNTPHWYAVKDGAESARIDITGVIGGSFFSDGTTARAFVDECKKLKAQTLDVHICSPGGDVAEGLSIYSYLSGLKAQGKTVVIHIDGLAASIASVIAQAGDRRVIAESAAIHVHNAWCYAGGNAAAFRAAAENLEKISGQLAGVYQARTGLSAAEVTALMDGPEGADGTLLTAAEALEKGFADEVEANKPAAACIGGDVWDNVPAELVKNEEEETPGKKKPGEEAEPEKPEEEAEPEKPEEELEKLRRENEQLKADADAAQARLARLAKNGLFPRPHLESSALNWPDALKACGGDYVKARRAYPAAYAAFMRAAK